MNSATSLRAAVTALKKVSRLRPRLAIILGSGFHHAAIELQVADKISYEKIPGFPRPTVKGHEGTLLFGRLGSTPVLMLSGRAHFYEGHAMEHVTFAVRALTAFGICDLLLTNAAGGINRSFRIGDFMVLTDHINFMGTSPLRGTPGFVDLTQVYDPQLNTLLSQAARECRITLRRGVYIAVCGPNYETPAEIRAFAKLGADVVGMSTVPEAIVARQCGMRIAGISCITNRAAGLAKKALSHQEVLETGESMGKTGATLLRHFARLYGNNQ